MQSRLAILFSLLLICPLASEAQAGSSRSGTSAKASSAQANATKVQKARAERTTGRAAQSTAQPVGTEAICW